MVQKIKATFSDKLLEWFDQYGRHDLPWQQEISPYRVWVSEIMLQQTQVKTVIPYYERFMQSFPTVKALARASQEEVLSHWAGLGYYARGRNLHKAAQLIMENHEGVFPSEFEDILALPGIGRSTAGAILSISLQQRFAILDGNVKRVLSRYFCIEGWPGEKAIENQLWLFADKLTPKQRFADYTQAIMDLGATLCTRSKPNCQDCPQQKQCQAYQQNRVTEFPYKKPKKDKPIKQAWLLIQSKQNGDVLLQKRPQKGIWGGLWSLPEFTSLSQCEQFVQSQTTSEQTLIEWDVFRHTFSHYHLDIHPIYLKIEDDCETATKVAENTAQYGSQLPELSIEDKANHGSETMPRDWYSLEALKNNKVGLPAPISKLIIELDSRLSDGSI